VSLPDAQDNYLRLPRKDALFRVREREHDVAAWTDRQRPEISRAQIGPEQMCGWSTTPVWHAVLTLNFEL
jgi:hypothetical protein